jgi:GNAT superfamily N-acetyltransferase
VQRYYYEYGEENLSRYNYDSITIRVDINFIYVLPEHRGKGISDFIAKAVTTHLCQNILKQITDFYYKEDIESPPITFTFDAETVSSGGENTLIKISNELEIVIDSAKDMQDDDSRYKWNLEHYSADFS